MAKKNITKTVKGGSRSARQALVRSLYDYMKGNRYGGSKGGKKH